MIPHRTFEVTLCDLKVHLNKAAGHRARGPAGEGTVQLVEETPFGSKFRVYGRIETPTGGVIAVVTVWIVLSDEDSPRFVTVLIGEGS